MLAMEEFRICSLEESRHTIEGSTEPEDGLGRAESRSTNRVRCDTHLTG